MKLVQILADIICKTLLDPEALARSRNRKGAFTRNCGKLPYWTLVKLLLANVKKTISASLDEFFHELRLASGAPLPDTVKCSQQAFSKARSGISHSIFKECFERMLDLPVQQGFPGFPRALHGRIYLFGDLSSHYCTLKNKHNSG